MKATVELLCRRDANLIKADAALNALLQYLIDENTHVSRSLYFSLINKLEERRTAVTDALKYLHSGVIDSPIYKHFHCSLPKDKLIVKIIYEVIKQAQPDEKNRESIVNDLTAIMEEEDLEEPPIKMTKTMTFFLTF